VRSLAHGIYPPLLASAGLGEALRAAARRSPLPVTVAADMATPVSDADHLIDAEERFRVALTRQ
jgi:hypothetical protein